MHGFPLLITTLYLAVGAVGYGNSLDTVRHTELVTELQQRGLSVPTGAGVGITQVEPPVDTGGSSYLPDPNEPEFAGKTITDQSGGGIPSYHATRVGRHLYGNTTSMAGGISTVHAYDANDWMNNKGWHSGTPHVEVNPLQNHSWVHDTSSTSATLRMDFAVVRDGFLPVVGLKNTEDAGDGISTVYASAYNGITVGVSDGTHKTGTTTVDGAGRTKPELLAPSSHTSYATPMVTAAAALLVESAGLTEAAKDQLTLKAILLAAADKTPFADWDQTTARPLDEVFGAGQLDVFESYFIQHAGPGAAGSALGTRGWILTDIDAGATDTYTLVVPAGFELRDLSALITWNRQVLRETQGRFLYQTLSYTAALADMTLTLTADSDGTVLQHSDSAVDNIEHIWRDAPQALPAGSYTLSVTSDTASRYALAWRSALYQDYALWQSAAFSDTTPTAERAPADDPDGDGIENLLEQAFGGDPESPDPENLPTARLVDAGTHSYLEISFRRPVFDNGLTYAVETTASLTGTWSSASADVERVSIAPDVDGFERHTYRRVAPVDAHDSAFLRVAVSD